MLKSATCPACDSEQRRPELTGRDALSGDSFDVVRCKDCGLAYVYPQPIPERLATYYPDDTYFADRHPFFKDQVMALRASKLGRPLPGARLLDIGCGRGDFLVACKRRGWSVVGAEQSQAPVMQLRRTLGIDVVTVEELATLPPASFDVVTLWHVFEHLAEPRAMLRQIHRLLKDGGRLLIEVPNFGGWQSRIGREAWFHLELPRHLLHFERRTLDGLLYKEGLVPERWRTFSLEYDTFGLLQAVLNRVCRTPNHLYQVLIREPTSGSRRDTVLSFALLLPVAAFAFAVSLAAAVFGQGGVLRVIARKRQKL